MMKRRPLPATTEKEVLVRSARRCALCFGINGDFDEKHGQIAHLDKNPSNHSLSNLSFLCLLHHDQYDGVTSQSKGYKKAEVLEYQRILFEKVSDDLRRDTLIEREADIEEQEYDSIHAAMDRLYSLDNNPELLEAEILLRAHKLFEYAKASGAWLNDTDLDWKNPNFDRAATDHEEMLRKRFDIPLGVYGLLADDLPDDWIVGVSELIAIWTSGVASYDDCTEILWELDENFDLDPNWLLFGLPTNGLPRLGYQLLQNFIYVFGMRRQATTPRPPD